MLGPLAPAWKLPRRTISLQDIWHFPQYSHASAPTTILYHPVLVKCSPRKTLLRPWAHAAARDRAPDWKLSLHFCKLQDVQPSLSLVREGILIVSAPAWPQNLNSSTLHELEICPRHVTHEGMIGRSASLALGTCPSQERFLLSSVHCPRCGIVIMKECSSPAPCMEASSGLLFVAGHIALSL